MSTTKRLSHTTETRLRDVWRHTVTRAPHTEAVVHRNWRHAPYRPAVDADFDLADCSPHSTGPCSDLDELHARARTRGLGYRPAFQGGASYALLFGGAREVGATIVLFERLALGRFDIGATEAVPVRPPMEVGGIPNDVSLPATAALVEKDV